MFVGARVVARIEAETVAVVVRVVPLEVRAVAVLVIVAAFDEYLLQAKTERLFAFVAETRVHGLVEEHLLEVDECLPRQIPLLLAGHGEQVRVIVVVLVSDVTIEQIVQIGLIGIAGIKARQIGGDHVRGVLGDQRVYVADGHRRKLRGYFVHVVYLRYYSIVKVVHRIAVDYVAAHVRRYDYEDDPHDFDGPMLRFEHFGNAVRGCARYLGDKSLFDEYFSG